MTSKYINFVVVYKKDDNYVAFPKRIDTMYNLYGAFIENHSYYGTLEIIQYVESYKKAKEVANEWNATYDRNNCLFEF